jgi:hypothetical protein
MCHMALCTPEASIADKVYFGTPWQRQSAYHAPPGVDLKTDVGEGVRSGYTERERGTGTHTQRGTGLTSRRDSSRTQE